ncbi:hypothetical protein ACQP1W_43985 [Spirillospora sp. CA-255316]
MLWIVLNDGLFRLSAAMPKALPFLIRLATDSSVPVRLDLAERVLLIAKLCSPVDEHSSQFEVMLMGLDSDRPERAECRTVLAEHAPECRTLLNEAGLTEGLLTTAEFDHLLEDAS